MRTENTYWNYDVSDQYVRTNNERNRICEGIPPLSKLEMRFVFICRVVHGIRYRINIHIFILASTGRINRIHGYQLNQSHTHQSSQYISIIIIRRRLEVRRHCSDSLRLLITFRKYLPTFGVSNWFENWVMSKYTPFVYDFRINFQLSWH